MVDVGMTDDALEGLEARNMERLNALMSQGANVTAGNPATERYSILLLEALVGSGVARRCREEAAEWFTDALRQAEEQVAEYRRRMVLLGNGQPPAQ